MKNTFFNASLKEKKVIIVGAGLVGVLLSLFLSKRGYRVQVFERNSKPPPLSPTSPKKDTSKSYEAHSINLALSVRGIRALKAIHLDKEILKLCVPMFGRLIHPLEGQPYFQSYGLKEKKEAIYSVSRSKLNKALLDFAKKEKMIDIHFQSKVYDIHLKEQKIFVERKDESKEALKRSVFTFDILIGADGSMSQVRKTLERENLCKTTLQVSKHAYKELTLSPLQKENNHSPSLPLNPSTLSKMSSNALHIWPRKNFMFIALPNLDKTLTGTLFMPLKGEKSFETINSLNSFQAFFSREFPDIFPSLRNLEKSISSSPGKLFTVKTKPWSFHDNVLLMGDAAHAILPFFGQGMNASFEDIRIFIEMLDEHTQSEHTQSELNQNKLIQNERSKKKGSLKNLFKTFYKLRYPHIRAIANMAMENYFEMRNKVLQKDFLLKKEVEFQLEKLFSKRYKSRYELVSFTHTPYKEAYERGQVQEEILNEILRNIQNPSEININKAEKLIKDNLKKL